MLVVSNFLRNITNSAKRIPLVLLVILCFSCSCNFRPFIRSSSISVSQLQKEAVQCVLKEYYKHTTKKVRSSTNVLVQKKSFYFKTGLGKISDSFPVSSGKVSDTILIETVPKIKLVKNVELIDSPLVQDRQNLKGNLWRFSPLFSTETEGFYTILSEKNNYESKEVSIHLIRRKKNGYFEYLLPINGYIVFY